MGPADDVPHRSNGGQGPSPLKAVTESGLHKAGAELRDPLAPLTPHGEQS